MRLGSTHKGIDGIDRMRLRASIARVRGACYKGIKPEGVDIARLGGTCEGIDSGDGTRLRGAREGVDGVNRACLRGVFEGINSTCLASTLLARFPSSQAGQVTQPTQQIQTTKTKVRERKKTLQETLCLQKRMTQHSKSSWTQRPDWMPLMRTLPPYTRLVCGVSLEACNMSVFHSTCHQCHQRPHMLEGHVRGHRQCRLRASEGRV